MTSAASLLASRVVEACRARLSVESGHVPEFVVCAGSRNSALVAELARGAQDGGLRVLHHYDERSAAFFAVGRLLVDGRPVAVVTTSGTAVAELLPAVIEAHYQGLPLLLVTADRPSDFRRSGAPQSIEQRGIFSGYVSGMRDVASAGDCEGLFEGWNAAAPFHLNVALPEPGRGEEIGRGEPGPYGPGAAGAAASVAGFGEPGGSAVPPERLGSFVRSADRLVVLLGALPPDRQSGVCDFVRAIGAPVWAEAASGLRGVDRLGGLLLRGGERSLREGSFAAVLRIGAVPSCRFWRDLECRPEVAVLSVTGSGYPGLARNSERMPFPDRWPDLAGFASVPESVGTADSAEWSRILTLFEEHPRSEPAMVHALSRIVPERAGIFLGNSLPIREWNAFADPDTRGRGVFASRGANGIDGQVSTFLGVADGHPEAWGLFGDLTVLYDLGGPWIEPQLRAGRRRIVVLNNGGGRIFDRLPALATLDDAARRILRNPHAIGFRPWAELWGWDHVRVDGSAEGWEDLAAQADCARRLICEIHPDADETESFWDDLAGSTAP